MILQTSTRDSSHDYRPNRDNILINNTTKRKRFPPLKDNYFAGEKAKDRYKPPLGERPLRNQGQAFDLEHSGKKTPSLVAL